MLVRRLIFAIVTLTKFMKPLRIWNFDRMAHFWKNLDILVLNHHLKYFLWVIRRKTCFPQTPQLCALKFNIIVCVNCGCNFIPQVLSSLVKICISYRLNATPCRDYYEILKAICVLDKQWRLPHTILNRQGLNSIFNRSNRVMKLINNSW